MGGVDHILTWHPFATRSVVCATRSASCSEKWGLRCGLWGSARMLPDTLTDHPAFDAFGLSRSLFTAGTDLGGVASDALGTATDDQMSWPPSTTRECPKT